MNVKEALKELRKEKGRKFSQSVDFIVNLKGIDLKRENVNLIANLPYKIKDKKICGFLTSKTNLIDSVTKDQFIKYKDKSSLKKLVNSYDFFIAPAPLMPSVATTFGKVLGPSGKMPSPQLGILPQDNDEAIKQVIDKITKAIKVRVKETSIKVCVGKENMSDEQLAENISSAYKSIIEALPKKMDNVKNIMLKMTMTKPIKVEMR